MDPIDDTQRVPEQSEAADAVTAVLRFRWVEPSDEPIGKSFELGIAQDGFRDESGIGAGGDRDRPLEARDAAAMLLARFDRTALERLLAQIARLHAAISGS